MILLSIETSCDETAISIVKKTRGKGVSFEVLSHKILSQINLHAKYGGVFPAVAKREHARVITQLIAESLGEAGLLIERKNDYCIPNVKRKKLESLLQKEEGMYKAMKTLFEGIQKPKIDALAVTEGPGLEPALWVGINAALALNIEWEIPIYPINHMEGHLVASVLLKNDDIYKIPEISYPAIGLLISGGHTEIVLMKKSNTYNVIGKTRDDAVGEAFDKVARMLELKYPGGPEISKLAEDARIEKLITPKELILPRPMLNSGNLEFSFSGLKTAVLTRIKNIESLNINIKKIISLEFENSITEVIISKINKAISENNAKSLIVGGGVSANNHLRKKLKELSEKENFKLFIPEKNLSTDNGLMIASTGLLHISNNKKPRNKLKAKGDWSVED